MAFWTPFISFVLTQLHAGVLQIKPEEVDIFLKGGGALDIGSVRKKPKACPPPQNIGLSWGPKRRICMCFTH